MPTVSIITMAHSSSMAFLERCMESVRDQTYKDFEHIVGIILPGNGDPRNYSLFRNLSITYNCRIVFVSDRGLCTTRNEIAEHAMGSYIMNLDADDLIHNQFLEKLVPLLGPKTLACPALHAFGDTTLTAYPTSPSYEELKKGNRIYCCSLYPRTDFWEVGGYDPVLDQWGYEDWLLWLDLMKNGCQVKVISDILFFYRTHPDSSQTRTLRYDRQRLEYIRKKHPL